MRLIDSDVIIWNWRSQEAAATLLAAEPFAISHEETDIEDSWIGSRRGIGNSSRTTPNCL